MFIQSLYLNKIYKKLLEMKQMQNDNITQINSIKATQPSFRQIIRYCDNVSLNDLKMCLCNIYSSDADKDMIANLIIEFDKKYSF